MYNVRINFVTPGNYSEFQASAVEVEELKEQFCRDKPFILTAANNETIVFPANIIAVVITAVEE